jgi:radical SAM superfamily enzyme YgiQ (UPF0313 family)
MMTGFIRPNIIRPPSERESYFLPLTRGCSNHSCSFCNYYYGSKLQFRDVDEVKAEIDALALYAQRGVWLPTVSDAVRAAAWGWDGKKVFLQDGDALVYPFPKLKTVLEHLNERLPALERIGTYATPQDLLRTSGAELAELKRLKLGIVYMGVESGDDELLRKVGKGATHDEVVEAGRKTREAGITLSVTVILGLGGVEGSARHALETARILTRIDPEYAGALTLTLVPGVPLHREWEQGRFSLISPLESLKELIAIIEHSSFTDCFFSSMHASNYFSVRGKLPEDKDKMLSALKKVVEKSDPSLLRPESLRGL